MLDKSGRVLLLSGAIVSLSACTGSPHAPSIPIMGSFFPAWVICAVIGVTLAMIVRIVLVRSAIDEHLPLPPLVYLCLAISLGIGAWMIWTGAA